jgi:response regulator RpfG family c-di-GMP phosphodiesterase
MKKLFGKPVIRLFLVNPMSESKAMPIIDDDSDFVRAIQALLVVSGNRVLSAVNGRNGLDLAKTARPDLNLPDVMMAERLTSESPSSSAPAPAERRQP